MPRRPRCDVLGQPQHVIQRGNNKTDMFTRAEEYHVFVEWLSTAINRYECRVHAYVLMTNHVHLIISPFQAGGIGRVMQSVGRRYVRYFNTVHGRTGSLWEGRYRATPIDSERYLMTCHRYIELNPVRAGLSSSPSGYKWSSHSANAFGIADRLISPHQLYLALGSNPEARRAAYRSLFRGAIEPSTLEYIRHSVHSQWPLGSSSYQQELIRL
jgi:putative transposase